jgi:hypothetical protein
VVLLSQVCSFILVLMFLFLPLVALVTATEVLVLSRRRLVVHISQQQQANNLRRRMNRSPDYIYADMLNSSFCLSCRIRKTRKRRPRLLFKEN